MFIFGIYGLINYFGYHIIDTYYPYILGNISLEYDVTTNIVLITNLILFGSILLIISGIFLIISERKTKKKNKKEKVELLNLVKILEQTDDKNE